MKRTFGAFMLLAGLTGCVTFGNNGQGDKKIPMPTPVTGANLPMGITPMGNPSVPPPASYTAWTPHPAHTGIDPTAVASVPMITPAAAPVAPTTSLPPSLQSASLQPAPTPELRPIPATRAARTPEMPTGMAVAYTPRYQPDSEPKPEIQQTSLNSTNDSKSDPMLPEIINGSKVENPRPRNVMPAKSNPTPVVATPPVSPAVDPATATPPPIVKKKEESAPLTSSLGGAPLLRLVNTKRITLNFEIADVGSSGVSAVDLWYTQDGKEWKKHEAPPNAKAYVVEVDEEGMYGFTLVARSGIGLGKEPPAAGDQPQVWVIVDLTKPDVQLTEVVTSNKSKTQEVSIKWNASDKNLGRNPVTLSYAESEDGPWTVLAANMSATGSYMWKVPANIPPRVFLRAEASDLAGNVGRAQSSKAILMDASMPKVSIVNVEANSGR